MKRRIAEVVAGSVALIAVLAGCGDNAIGVDAPPMIAPDAPPPGEPRFDVGLHRGRIEVMEVHGVFGAIGQAHASFATQPTATRLVFYARVAVFHWQEETMRAGSCRLLEHMPTFCTACPGLCVADGVCEDPYPTHAPAGTLSFAGLRVPLALTPNPYWYASQGPLGVGGDVFADDATVTVSASGDQVPAFAALARGVAPMAADIPNGMFALADSADAMLRWTAVAPADPALRVRLTINANNQGHGQPFAAVIECDTADVGSVAIPAAIIEAFPTEMGGPVCVGSDCPTSTVTRYRQATVAVGGAPVDLVVGSQQHFYVTHP